MQIPDKELETACRGAAEAAVNFLLEVAADYRKYDKQAGMVELVALLTGQREAVVLGATERAFQAIAEVADPQRFSAGGGDGDDQS